MSAAEKSWLMLSTFAKRSAAGGVIVWLITLLLTTSDSEQAELVHKVVFWAVLVIVPLGLSVVADQSKLYKVIVFAQPVAALITISSFFEVPGISPIMLKLSSGAVISV